MAVSNFRYDCPFGGVYGYITSSGVSELWLVSIGARGPSMLREDTSPVARDLAAALKRYFEGVRETFEGIPLDLERHTAFRRAVWHAAQRVTWGKTLSYGGLCESMGRSLGTARAVGQALGANPIPLIIPCHRILAGNGRLGGFSCGLDWKVRLLELERHVFKDGRG